MEEKKLLDESGLVVTTQRFIVGDTIHELDRIHGAVPYVSRPWVFAILLALIAAGLLLTGQVVLMALGLLLGALIYWTWGGMTDSTLLLMNDGDPIQVKIKDVKLLNLVCRKINGAIEANRAESRQALRSELDSLPEA